MKGARLFDCNRSSSQHQTFGIATSALDEMLHRESHYRPGDDIQLVISLLGLQGRHAVIPEVRRALTSAMERVVVLAQARIATTRERRQSLKVTLQQVCDTVQAQAEAQSILISLQADREVEELSTTQIVTVALVVNELLTNAVRHAFAEGKAGHIRVSLDRGERGDAVISVDDDGLPLPDEEDRREGLGLSLAKRLIGSIGGMFIPPPPGSKVFTLRVPAAQN